MAYSADPEQPTSVGAVLSGSTMFAQTYSTKYLGKWLLLFIYSVKEVFPQCDSSNIESEFRDHNLYNRIVFASRLYVFKAHFDFDNSSRQLIFS